MGAVTGWTRRCLLLCCLVAFAVAPARRALADEAAALARQVSETHGGAVVAVKLVINVRMIVEGRQVEEDERATEIRATVIDPSGLAVCSLSEIDPSGQSEFMMEEDPEYRFETEVKDVKILLPDGKELAAKVVLRDKDLDLVIDAFAAVAETTSIQELRHRVEHAGCWFFTPDRRRRFRELGLIAVPNINFLYTFGDGVRVTLGPQRTQRDIFPLKSMLREGMLLVSGTDGPNLEPCDALRDIGTAILRTTEKGVAMDPSEAITVMEGIRMFTINQAYVAFEEDCKGSIEPAKLADLVVLAEDPRTTPPERLKDIQVDVTILDGKVVYDREDAVKRGV